MKWIIASDLHGSAHYCRQLLEAWKREEAPRMLFLGDLLYHGPRNDLPEGYAPKEVIALLQERQADIFCVRGIDKMARRLEQAVVRKDGEGQHHLVDLGLAVACSSRRAILSMPRTATILTRTICRPCIRATSCSTATRTFPAALCATASMS